MLRGINCRNCAPSIRVLHETGIERAGRAELRLSKTPPCSCEYRPAATYVFAAQSAGTAAVVRYGDDCRDSSMGRSLEALCRSADHMVFQAAQQGREARAAAQSDDPHTRQRFLFLFCGLFKGTQFLIRRRVLRDAWPATYAGAARLDHPAKASNRTATLE